MKSLLIVLLCLTGALYVQATSCWDTLESQASSLVEYGYDIAEDSEYSQIPNFVVAMRNLCDGCGYTCGFLSSITDTDVQAIQCVTNLYGIVQEAVEAVSTGGVDFFADLEMLDDLYKAIEGCESLDGSESDSDW